MMLAVSTACVPMPRENHNPVLTMYAQRMTEDEDQKDDGAYIVLLTCESPIHPYKFQACHADGCCIWEHDDEGMGQGDSGSAYYLEVWCLTDVDACRWEMKEYLESHVYF